jgi:LmbE family N-acetylglucosaminyl deacetylase
MKLKNPTAKIFVPDCQLVEKSLKRTTHMGIGAHQDDLEFMAFHGILECFQNDKKWFCGVTVTNGGGSPRANEYANYTDKQMQRIRRLEQNKAALIGEYGAMVSLDYPSSAVKDPKSENVIEDIRKVIGLAQPGIIYTHNLADKHDTHIAVAIAVIKAIRSLPETTRPKALYGCEVWRNLDWVKDSEKTVFDVSSHENLMAALMGVFDSQITGGKRYDIATLGRKRSNATYHASHAIDKATASEYAMDLTPLIKNPTLDIVEYVTGFISRFADDVAARISKQLDK